MFHSTLTAKNTCGDKLVSNTRTMDRYKKDSSRQFGEFTVYMDNLRDETCKAMHNGNLAAAQMATSISETMSEARTLFKDIENAVSEGKSVAIAISNIPSEATKLRNQIESDGLVAALEEHKRIARQACKDKDKYSKEKFVIEDKTQDIRLSKKKGQTDLAASKANTIKKTKDKQTNVKIFADETACYDKKLKELNVTVEKLCADNEELERSNKEWATLLDCQGETLASMIETNSSITVAKDRTINAKKAGTAIKAVIKKESQKSASLAAVRRNLTEMFEQHSGTKDEKKHRLNEKNLKEETAKLAELEAELHAARSDNTDKDLKVEVAEAVEALADSYAISVKVTSELAEMKREATVSL
jgi:hypothetical protein